MNYCAVEEAFDNPLNKQIKEYEDNKNNYINKITKTVEDNQKEYNNEEYINNGIIEYPKFIPSYFNAQGDFESDNVNKNGTSIKDIKNKDIKNKELEELSLDGSIGTGSIGSILDDSDINSQKSESLSLSNIYDHQYYINEFINYFTKENESIKSSNTHILNHISKCKICKNSINKIIKKNKKDKIEGFNIGNVKDMISKKINTGYEIKEIVIIILIGIVIIFLMDLFVKLGKLLTKIN